MEINLTKIWRIISAPFRWVFAQLLRFSNWLTNSPLQSTGARRTSNWRRVFKGKMVRKQGGRSAIFSKLPILNKTSLNKTRSRQRVTANTPADKARQQLSRIKLFRSLAVGLFGLVILGVLGFFTAFAYLSRELPQPGQVVRRDGFSTKFYDRNEQLLYDLFVDQRRTQVKLKDLPPELIKATIAIEDKDFYNHRGFDVLTAVRIPYNLVFRQRVVGGSTLTQQLVKNVLLSNERTITRKFKELVLAIQIERTFSKDEILEMYLNEVPYGGTAWGAVSASELYFNKPVSELNLVESAFLAGLPQRPSVYSPFSSRVTDEEQPLWQMRTKAVLQRMREEGYIDREQYNEAVEAITDLTFDKGTLEIKAPHFIFYATAQLTEMFGEALVEAGGLTVITSLDLPLHEKAQEIVTQEVEAVEHLHITNGSALIMDPRTGEILSMVGSRNFFDNEKGGQFNVAADGLRQPGSAIKPVTYLGLLQKGYTPAYMLVDAPTDFRHSANENPYTPRNYTGTFQGPISVRKSLGNSLNIPAVKALALVGIEDFLQLAHEMGFETLAPTQQNLNRFGLSLTLGGGEVRLIDMVSAYSAFANSGTKVEPVAILKVTDRDGRVLYEHRPVEGKRVMSKGEAFLINHILADDSARAIAFGANSFLNLGPDVAVKTGTTNDMIDNWTVGWSQEVIVGTWVGNNDNSSMLRVASGTTGASPIWRKIMLAVFEAGYHAPPWQVPEDEVELVEVDAISGYPVHDDFAGKMEYVIKKTLPSLPDPVHKNVKACKGENKLATEAMIARGDYDKREVIDLRRDDPLSTDGVNRWMEGVHTWIESQDDSRYHVPTEYCGDVREVSVRLERPKDKEEFDHENIEVKISAGSDVGIEKIELWVDGEKRETIESSYYEGKVRLSAGQHELFAKAFSNAGKVAETGKVRIGTGGQPWEKPKPTLTPEPTPAPTAKPKPTTSPTKKPEPIVTPKPDDGPSPVPSSEPGED